MVVLSCLFRLHVLYDVFTIMVIAAMLINLLLWTYHPETAYPSGAPEFNPGFSGVRVTQSLVLYV